MPLSDVEVRILGCLVEKAFTTPDVYPLSLNALTNACNQTSNRDPVMDLSEDTVKWAVNSLRQQSLVRAIQPADSRVMKFQHLLAESKGLERPALAVLCVLMLRGPQTPGEIKGRTGRLAEFATVADVDAVIESLISMGLVMQLERRPGQKEARYAQLLSGPPAVVETQEPAVEIAAQQLGAKVDRIASLEATIDELRGELAELRAQFEDFKRQFG
jgi:uncharacterized protein YceH (UPF0502 family)